MLRRRALYSAAGHSCDDTALVEFAFPYTQDLRRRREAKVNLRLGYVTNAEMQKVLDAIEQGSTPQVAMLVHAGIAAGTTSQYLADAADGAGDLDPRLYAFRDAILTAQACARSFAEGVVLAQQPVSWLTRGPAGRSTKDTPGWSEPKEPVVQAAMEITVDPATRKQRIALLLSKIERTEPDSP